MNSDILRFLRYLSFRMDCLRHQEANPLTLDVEKAQGHYDELQDIIQEKLKALTEVMPKVPVYKHKKCPEEFYKKDGTYSKKAVGWFEFLKQQKLPKDTTGSVRYIVGYTEGNPKSTPQVKEWLFSMGWSPCTFKFERNKITGDEKKIPQVRYSALSDPRKGQLTDSVLRLKEVCPEVEILEGLTVAQHRSSIFEGFLKSHQNGAIVSSAGGLTNTLRLKHRAPIVNLPGVKAAWGEAIRGCLVAPEGHVMCGSDVSSLEDMTKRHFMWVYDPSYVKEMAREGFDPHLDLAKYAGVVSQEDIDAHHKGEKNLKSVRTKYKQANYSCVYGIGAPKLARETGVSQKEAKKLLDAYWERNWAVKKVADSMYVKTLKDGSTWLKNPVSGFYYSLRYGKDKWSTTNQGTGVYVFDSWVMRMRKKGINPQLSYHDEVLFSVPKGQEQQAEDALRESMAEVNKSLGLNVEIEVDVKFGDNYAEVH